MACPVLLTGDRFLTRAIAHIDCQAQLLGSFGYQSLAQPGSLAFTVMTSLLTLFVALFALRLMFGPTPGARDVVQDMLMVGIALTLVSSWPAVQTLLYNVVVGGPVEIAAAIGTPALPSTGTGFVARLQGVDSALVRLIEIGTGRASGVPIGEAASATFAGSALQDDAAFGWARVIYLAGTVGLLGLLRLFAGLLLALAPLAAGLILFDTTRGVFAGWLRGLAFALVGLVGLSLTLAVEVALAEPWLADAIRVRQLGYSTPAAPLEILALMLAMTMVQLGLLWLLARVIFARANPLRLPHRARSGWRPAFGSQPVTGSAQALAPAFAKSRVLRTADSVRRLQRHEEAYTASRRTEIFDERRHRQRDALASASASGGESPAPAPRRAAPRGSRVAAERDLRP